MNKRYVRKCIRKSPLKAAWPAVKEHGRDGYSIEVVKPTEYIDQNEFTPEQRLTMKLINGELSPADIVSFELEGDEPPVFSAEALKREEKLTYPLIPIQDDSSRVSRAKRSRFGGLPMVPEGFKWPSLDGRFFEFLGQVFLDELPRSPARSELPQSGSLLFFVDEVEDYESPLIPASVVYLSADTRISPATSHPRATGWVPGQGWGNKGEVDPVTLASETQDIGFLPRYFLPEQSPDFDFQPEEFDLALIKCVGEELASEFSEVKDEITSHEKFGYNDYGHRLLGMQTSIQSPATAEVRNNPFQNPRLLAQFAAFGAFSWGDMGHMHIFIEDEALTQSDFSHTVAVWECG